MTEMSSSSELHTESQLAAPPALPTPAPYEAVDDAPLPLHLLAKEKRPTAPMNSADPSSTQGSLFSSSANPGMDDSNRNTLCDSPSSHTQVPTSDCHNADEPITVTVTAASAGAGAGVQGSAAAEAEMQPAVALPRAASRDDCTRMVESALAKEAGVQDDWVDNLMERSESAANDEAARDSEHGDGAPRPPRATLRGFFHEKNLKVAAIPFVCGMINGYTIGYVAPYTQLYKMSTNCALYTAPKGCEAVPFADCVWSTDTTTLSDGTTRSVGYCGWRGFTCRAAYPNDAWMGGGGNTALAEASCLQDSRCTWSYSAKECQNPAGFSASYTGLFAGCIIAGSMFGAILGGPLVTSMGARLTFVISGILSIICSIMGHVDVATNEFWVLVVERFVIGIFMGLITVACPLYVNTNAEPLYRRKLGTLFQVFTTFGVFLAGTIGLGVGQSMPFKEDRDANISGRMQGLASGQTALSIAMIFLGVFCSESKVRYGKHTGGLNQNEYSYRDMMGPLLMSVVINGTMRLTGFNAILNFAPTILGGLGLAPLVGNTIMTIFNFVGTLVSIPLDSFFSIRSIFLFGSCFISCMCLFFCGVPVYPGVASESVTNGCAITGIIVFIFGFEVFVGPSFYVLCQEIFPPSFRPRGNSFAQLWQFIINLVINVCYPIAVERFSGGPAGNQHKGQSIVFIFFGGVGLVCFVIEFFFLKVWDEEKQGKAKKNVTGLDGLTPGEVLHETKKMDTSLTPPASAVSNEIHNDGNLLADDEDVTHERRDTTDS